MTNEIQEIIAKNLPAQVGRVLQERLQQADQDQAELAKLKTTIVNLNQTIDQHQSELKEWRAKDSQLRNLKELEAELQKKSTELKVDELHYQLANEKDKTSFVKEVALGLVRNTEFRKTVFDSESGPNGKDQYGNQLYATHTKNVTETAESK